MAEADPNPAHIALAEMERHVPKLNLITQNVDGLHHLAGSKNVIELHGNIARTVCSNEGKIVDFWSGDDYPPRCPHCGSLLRPDVVWFGEPLPWKAIEDANRACQDCDLFFSIGTSSIVYPAASLPLIAQQNGATIVEINLDETPLSPRSDFIIRGSAGQVLPHLLRATSNK